MSKILQVTQNAEKTIVDINYKEDENLLPLPFWDEEQTIGISGWFGEKTDYCGNFKSLYYSGSEFKHSYLSCRKQTCPICFRKWAEHRAEETSSYLWQLTEFMAKFNRFRKSQHLYHCTISFSNDITPAESKKRIKLILKKMKQYHIEPKYFGATICHHPYRLKKECCGCSHIQSKENKFCEKCGFEQFTNLHWEKGCHYHLITNFFISKDKLKEFQADLEKYDAVFVNISQSKKRKNKNIEGYIYTMNELRSIVAYELGHAELIQGKKLNAITHFGIFSRSGKIFDCKKEVVKEIVKDTKDQPFYKVDAIIIKEEDEHFTLETNLRPSKSESGLMIYLKRKTYKYTFELKYQYTYIDHAPEPKILNPYKEREPNPLLHINDELLENAK